MSYCRWSSDNFKCDVYCYESCYDNYVIHVASMKIVTELPENPLKYINNHEKFLDKHKTRQTALDKAERKPIGLPSDGKTYICDTLREMYDKLKELKDVGYHIPDYVFEDIEEEMNNKFVE